jgi:hypothetical protein
MADHPRAKANRNCRTCHYYYADTTTPGQGQCVRSAPTGSGNTGTGPAAAGDEFALIPATIAGTAWCGEWKKWEGEARSTGA